MLMRRTTPRKKLDRLRRRLEGAQGAVEGWGCRRLMGRVWGGLERFRREVAVLVEEGEGEEEVVVVGVVGLVGRDINCLTYLSTYLSTYLLTYS